MDSKRRGSAKYATLLVAMYKRRGIGGMIRLGEPFPAKPLPPKPIYRNIIREALDIKDFLTEDSQRTYLDAGRHFKLTRPRISQLIKIVHDLPAPFIEKMRLCDDQDILKAFSGKNLSRISAFGTEKERQDAIYDILQRIEERKHYLFPSGNLL